MGRFDLGGNQGGRRRELAGKIEKENAKALANGSKKKIRDLMHLLYEHAIRYEWADRNPITSVRQSGMRQETPIRLSVDQLSRLIYQVLRPQDRLMVLLDFGTGLRRGELTGVRWEDISFEDKGLTPKRSIVKQRIGRLRLKPQRRAFLSMTCSSRNCLPGVSKPPMPRTRITSLPAQKER